MQWIPKQENPLCTLVIRPAQSPAPCPSDIQELGTTIISPITTLAEIGYVNLLEALL